MQELEDIIQEIMEIEMINSREIGIGIGIGM